MTYMVLYDRFDTTLTFKRYEIYCPLRQIDFFCRLYFICRKVLCDPECFFTSLSIPTKGSVVGVHEV